MSWPEPVERVSAYLRAAGAEARVEQFEAGTPTAQAAAEAVGCRLAEIVKSLVLLCDGRPLVVLVPGDRRADLRKVAGAAGCARIAVAGPEDVRAATGFEPGAVAPFPLPLVQDVYMDRTLLVHELLWAGAGSPQHMVALPPFELRRLARARAMDAVEDST